ncbi:MAG: hypothetical protein WD058_03230 [Dehalococcoidia bacterium]
MTHIAVFQTIARGRRMLLVAATIATALVLVACDGGDGDPSPAATADATTPAAATTAPATETPTTEATPTSTGDDAGDGLALDVTEDDELGSFLVGPEGLTLYVFTQDEPGVSNCSGQCLDNWPPLLAEEGQEVDAPTGAGGEFATIERDDGTLQVTYDDAPLYYWMGDAQPGDTTGHGVSDVWFVATVDESAASAGGSQTTSGDVGEYLY